MRKNQLFGEELARRERSGCEDHEDWPDKREHTLMMEVKNQRFLYAACGRMDLDSFESMEAKVKECLTCAYLFFYTVKIRT